MANYSLNSASKGIYQQFLPTSSNLSLQEQSQLRLFSHDSFSSGSIIDNKKNIVSGEASFGMHFLFIFWWTARYNVHQFFQNKPTNYSIGSQLLWHWIYQDGRLKWQLMALGSTSFFFANWYPYLSLCHLLYIASKHTLWYYTLTELLRSPTARVSLIKLEYNLNELDFLTIYHHLLHCDIPLVQIYLAQAHANFYPSCSTASSSSFCIRPFTNLFIS